jgi:dihydrofolate reductase
MRKIRIIEQISLDGVIQAPGGRNEGGDDYAYGGWAMLYGDTAIIEAIVAAQGRRFDLLLGRRTYDIFAGYWPKVKNGRLADGLNAATK